MPINVSWNSDVENLIQWEFVTPWTWEDLYHAMEEEERLLAERGNIPHDTMGIVTSNTFPAGGMFSHGINVLKKRKNRPGQVMTVVYTRSAFMVSIMNMIVKLSPEYREDLVAVDSLEGAYDILRKKRQVEAA